MERLTDGGRVEGESQEGMMAEGKVGSKEGRKEVGKRKKTK